MRPWNTQIESRIFWDPSHNDGQGQEIKVTQSLKDALTNFSGMKDDYLLRTVAIGLQQVMEAIDEMDTNEQS